MIYPLRGTLTPVLNRCDACRRRRIGCLVEPGQMSCNLCRHRGQACTFLSGAPKKKKRRETPQHRAECNEPPSSLVTSSAAVSPQVTGSGNGVSDHTFLYSGLSGDQNVFLLRHLPFDASCLFGTNNWTIWRASTDSPCPAYFTVGWWPYSTSHMDGSDAHNTT